MELKSNIEKYKISLLSLFDFKEINFFIPIVIIFSDLKFYGYVCFFIFYLPYILANRKLIFISIKNSSKVERIVLIYFLFLLLEIFYGSYFIKDVRIIIYWLPLLITFIAAYFKNIYDLNTSIYYKSNYLKIIYKSTFYYFLFYFFMSILGYIFGEGFYSIQDNFWVGSSSAFGITSILFYGMFQLWEKNNFKFFSSFSLVLVFYILLALMHDSRLSLFYILIALSFLIIQNIRVKKYLKSISYLLMITSCYILFSYGITFFHNSLTFIKPLSSSTLSITPQSKGLIQNDGRVEEFFKGYKKFSEYPLINKVIGTGWYSSRITIKYDGVDIRNRNFKAEDKSGYSLQGIVAILLDTGIIGILFLLVLYILTCFSIILRNMNFMTKLFLIILILVNFLCLFIGYPLVNIAFVMFFLPGGITYISKINKKGLKFFI